MSTHNDTDRIAWWAHNLEDVDREIARLCLICQVRILEPGVIERVLRKDDSVCGTSNHVAFAKLHELLMLHFGIRKKVVQAVGQVQTGQIEAHVIEQLRSRFADAFGKWPPE